MTVDKGIFIKNIYYMLSYAFQELRKNNYAEIAGEEFDDIHDLFAEIIARGVSAQLKKGLHRRYIDTTDSLTTLRGKLNISETVRIKASGRQRLSCEFDEYSEDNLFNQILKSTMSLLAAHSKVNRSRKRALLNLISFFSNVSSVDLKRVKWSQLKFDRNSKTYRMLLYLCWFVADNMLLSTDAGDIKLHEFAEDKMCRLYERFVLTYYRRHHPELRAAARQIEWNVLKEKSTMDMLPTLQTDIMLTFSERTLIIDTKYYGKTFQTHHDKKSIHSKNQFQILTYVLNHDKNHSGKTDGMLLYAKTREEVHPDGEMHWHDGNIIYYRTLDLSKNFDDIKIQLEKIVKIYD